MLPANMDDKLGFAKLGSQVDSRRLAFRAKPCSCASLSPAHALQPLSIRRQVARKNALLQQQQRQQNVTTESMPLTEGSFLRLGAGRLSLSAPAPPPLEVLALRLLSMAGGQARPLGRCGPADGSWSSRAESIRWWWWCAVVDAVMEVRRDWTFAFADGAEAAWKDGAAQGLGGAVYRGESRFAPAKTHKVIQTGCCLVPQSCIQPSMRCNFERGLHARISCKCKWVCAVASGGSKPRQ